jgi:hypothetical protein
LCKHKHQVLRQAKQTTTTTLVCCLILLAYPISLMSEPTRVSLGDLIRAFLPDLLHKDPETNDVAHNALMARIYDQLIEELHVLLRDMDGTPVDTRVVNGNRVLLLNIDGPENPLFKLLVTQKIDEVTVRYVVFLWRMNDVTMVWAMEQQSELWDTINGVVPSCFQVREGVYGGPYDLTQKAQDEVFRVYKAHAKSVPVVEGTDLNFKGNWVRATVSDTEGPLGHNVGIYFSRVLADGSTWERYTITMLSESTDDVPYMYANRYWGPL